MSISPEIDPNEIPLDPQETQPPLRGTVDDNDDADDERWDENEAPDHAVTDETQDE